ncbi:hypothetical protein [Photobacterium kishitanii]|uniref:PspA/IM30 family protein n=1 Tax=Photobacterium kishitanii TaxID=318456 RepID=A0A2T3KM70_9GAMM|nr:hypothetical protein [Photobacterium kishitanii]PSV00899.1 hypothetical protein C9J27_02410 [Photobacterium kishitanii]
MGLLNTVCQFLKIGAHNADESLNSAFQLDLVQQENRDHEEKLRKAKDVFNNNTAILMEKKREEKSLEETIRSVLAEGKKAHEKYTNALNDNNTEEANEWAEIMSGLGTDVTKLKSNKDLVSESVRLLEAQVAECNNIVKAFEKSIKQTAEEIEAIKVQEQFNDCNAQIIDSMKGLSIDDTDTKSKLDKYRKDVQRKSDLNSIKMADRQEPKSASEAFKAKINAEGEGLNAALEMFK